MYYWLNNVIYKNVRFISLAEQIVDRNHSMQWLYIGCGLFHVN